MSQIKVKICPNCQQEEKSQYTSYCSPCWQDTNQRHRLTEVSRDKVQVQGDFKVVDWYATRSSALILLQDREGNRYSSTLTDFFSQIEGLTFQGMILEEVKKGSAYGWKPI